MDIHLSNMRYSVTTLTMLDLDTQPAGTASLPSYTATLRTPSRIGFFLSSSPLTSPPFIPAICALAAQVHSTPLL